jgi:hypothetical protein
MPGSAGEVTRIDWQAIGQLLKSDKGSEYR